MSEAVHWLLELAVKAGARERLDELMAEMIEATKAGEPGALIYEWYISEDGGHCHIYERYRDSAAVMTHLGNFSEHFAGRFMDILTPERMAVYGPANDTVRAALDTLGAKFWTPIGGFAR